MAGFQYLLVLIQLILSEELVLLLCNKEANNMQNTVFSTRFFTEVHDIEIKTQKGRRFIIDISKNDNEFSSTVTVLDVVSGKTTALLYNISPASPSALDNFIAAVTLVKSYLSEHDSEDNIQDIHNPCNTPFINQEEQNDALAHQGIPISVRVN